jgi:hypothetical protein
MLLEIQKYQLKTHLFNNKISQDFLNFKQPENTVKTTRLKPDLAVARLSFKEKVLMLTRKDLRELH